MKMWGRRLMIWKRPEYRGSELKLEITTKLLFSTFDWCTSLPYDRIRERFLLTHSDDGNWSALRVPTETAEAYCADNDGRGGYSLEMAYPL